MITTRSTYDQVLTEVEAVVEDVTGDMPDVNPDDVFHDVALSLLIDANRTVAREFCRSHFGWVPEQLTSMWRRQDEDTRVRRLARDKQVRDARKAARVVADQKALEAMKAAQKANTCSKCFTVRAANGSCLCG